MEKTLPMHLRTLAQPNRFPRRQQTVTEECFMPNQPIPKVTEDDVMRVVRRDFPSQHIDEVLAVLARYGEGDGSADVSRVRLAVLKLAAGNLERLRKQVETARCDFRDVLAFAEYPEYFARVTGAADQSREKVQRIIDADWNQYQEWLQR